MKMHLVAQPKWNAAIGRYDIYYRIKESYRNAKGNVCVRFLLNIGFMREDMDKATSHAAHSKNIISRQKTKLLNI